MPQPLRRGRRVELVRPTLGHAAHFVAAAQRSRDLHRSWVTPPLDRRTFANWVRRCRQPDYEGLLLLRRTDGLPVGVINLSAIIRGAFQNAFVGYYGFADSTGCGYMTDGMKLVARFAFEDLRLHRLEANIQPDNTRSIALVRRAGFEFEGLAVRYLKIAGRWRDHEHWVRRNE